MIRGEGGIFQAPQQRVGGGNISSNERGGAGAILVALGSGSILLEGFYSWVSSLKVLQSLGNPSHGDSQGQGLSWQTDGSPPSPEASMKSRKGTCGGNLLCAVLSTSGSEVSGRDAIIPWITGDHPASAHSNMHSGINRNLHRKTNLSKWKIKKKQIAQKPNKDILVNYESYLLIAKVIMKWCPPCYYSLSLQNHSLYSSVTIKQTLTEDQWAPSANTEIKGAEAEQSPTGNFRVKKHPRGTTKYSTNLTACSSLFHVCIPSSLPLLPFYQHG